MNMIETVPLTSDLSVSVRDIFAQVTRYPLEVLDPTAGLEEDLGIDSVKLGEVFAVLRERYKLPEKIDLQREKLKTIAGIVEALHAYLRATTPVQSTNGYGSQKPPDVQANVLDIFAQVTRYPLEVLEPGASLEE